MTTDLTPDIIEQARRVLVDEGADSEGGWHSWRCFDRDRYPGPCDCTEEIVRAALSAVAPLIAAQALEELRDYLAEDRRVWHGDRGVQVATDTSDPRTMIPLGEFLSARAAKLREAGR